MSHTGSTRVSFKAVAFLVVLLAFMLLGPAPIKAANPLPQGNAYTFGPTGVTYDREVHLSYHNLTADAVQVRFILLNASGKDLFVVNKINATFIVAPGTMMTDVMPCNGIMGPNETRTEVTGMVALFPPPGAPGKFKPGTFLGPASLQVVDEITQETLVAVGAIGPVEQVGAIGPIE